MFTSRVQGSNFQNNAAINTQCLELNESSKPAVTTRVCKEMKVKIVYKLRLLHALVHYMMAES